MAMIGVDIKATGDYRNSNGNILKLSPGNSIRKCKSKSIMIRPSVSRGRGYAVVLEVDETDNVTIQPAPRTATLARIGRFDAIPQPVTISDIPDSVMNKIFGYVDEPKTILRARAINKQWCRVIDSSYVKKSTAATGRFTSKLTPLTTAKIKIFGDSKVTCGIETVSQPKEDTTYREVTVKVKENETSDQTQQLIRYLRRLASFLTPTQSCLFTNIEISDELMTFLLSAWQPRLSELRFFLCSFDQISIATVEAILQCKKLKHLYIDDCLVSPTCPLVTPPNLLHLGQAVSRLELCCRGDESVLSMIDDDFLKNLSTGWTKRESIRWLKLKAPKITTDAIENLVGAYFRLRYNRRRDDSDDKKSFLKPPQLTMWFCDTAVDVDDLLSRRSGKKWFRETPLPIANRRKLYDAYNQGEDLVIWFEKTTNTTTTPVENGKPVGEAGDGGNE